MRKLVAFALISMLLASCSSLGTPVTRENNFVQMPHYAFTVPLDQGWQIQRVGGNFESVSLNNKVGPISFQLALMRNVVLDANMRTQSANIVADHFREMEEQTMIEQGVKRGQYQLKNLVKDTRKLGNKTFYTMTYEAFGGAQTQFAALYLLFPKSEGNDSFIVAYYSESLPVGTPIARSYKADIETLLQEMLIR